MEGAFGVREKLFKENFVRISNYSTVSRTQPLLAKINRQLIEMTKILSAIKFTVAALFLSCAGTNPGHANANRIAFNCQEQQVTKFEYSAKWDKATKKPALKATEEEIKSYKEFSLLVDFKRNQSLYSEEGAWFLMNIVAGNDKQISLFFAKDDTLGSELLYVDLDRSALSFKKKYILSWDNTAVWELKGQCRSVNESEINYQVEPFPPID